MRIRDCHVSVQIPERGYAGILALPQREVVVRNVRELEEQNRYEPWVTHVSLNSSQMH